MKHLENLEGCLSGSLAIVASLLIACFIIAGCAAPRHVTQLVEHVQKDTVYLSNIQYDSIYVYQDKYLDRLRDTILIREINTEIRYKILRDTIEQVKLYIQRDSIPYEVRIETIKEVPRKRCLFDYISYACLGLLIGTLLTMLYFRLK